MHHDTTYNNARTSTNNTSKHRNTRTHVETHTESTQHHHTHIEQLHTISSFMEQSHQRVSDQHRRGEPGAGPQLSLPQPAGRWLLTNELLTPNNQEHHPRRSCSRERCSSWREERENSTSLPRGDERGISAFYESEEPAEAVDLARPPLRRPRPGASTTLPSSCDFELTACETLMCLSPKTHAARRKNYISTESVRLLFSLRAFPARALLGLAGSHLPYTSADPGLQRSGGGIIREIPAWLTPGRECFVSTGAHRVHRAAGGRRGFTPPKKFRGPGGSQRTRSHHGNWTRKTNN